MSALVIVNRRAHGLAKEGPLLAEVRRRRAGVDIVETSSLDELERAAKNAPETVVLAGGDGGTMAGVTALARSRPTLPRVGLVPGGTMSTIARNLVPFGDPVVAARELLDAIASGQARTRACPTLRVQDRVGFIFGAGLVSRFFERYAERGAGGALTAARIVARVFAGSLVGGAFARSVLEPTRCVVEVDGLPAPFGAISLLCAGVVRNLGLGMRLLYRAGEATDRFHVVGTPLGPRLLGPQLPLVLAGRPLVGPRLDTLARTLTLHFPQASHTYVLDGELLDGDAVDVRAGPLLEIVSP